MFNANQATSAKTIQCVMGSRHGTLPNTHENGLLGEDPLRPIHTRTLNEGLIEPRKGDEVISILK